jgi:hypothetical protein
VRCILQCPTSGRERISPNTDTQYKSLTYWSRGTDDVESPYDGIIGCLDRFSICCDSSRWAFRRRRRFVYRKAAMARSVSGTTEPKTPILYLGLNLTIVEIRVPRLTTDDCPNIGSTFRSLSGARGARIQARADCTRPLTADTTSGGDSGDLLWKYLGIPWSKLIVKRDRNCSSTNSRPIFIATDSLYVMLGKDLAFGVGGNVSPNGKCVAHCDVVVCPMRNSSSLRDVDRVPERINDLLRHSRLIAGGVHLQ